MRLRIKNPQIIIYFFHKKINHSLSLALYPFFFHLFTSKFFFIGLYNLKFSFIHGISKDIKPDTCFFLLTQLRKIVKISKKK